MSDLPRSKWILVAGILALFLGGMGCALVGRPLDGGTRMFVAIIAAQTSILLAARAIPIHTFVAAIVVLDGLLGAWSWYAAENATATLLWGTTWIGAGLLVGLVAAHIVGSAYQRHHYLDVRWLTLQGSGLLSFFLIPSLGYTRFFVIWVAIVAMTIVASRHSAHGEPDRS